MDLKNRLVKGCAVGLLGLLLVIGFRWNKKSLNLANGFSVVKKLETPADHSSSKSTANGFGDLRPVSRRVISDPAAKGFLPSKEMAAAVEDRLNQAKLEFQKLERANTKPIGKIEAEGLVDQYMLISVPNAEDFTRYVAVLTSVFSDLPDDVKDWSNDRQIKLLNEFTSYSKQFVVVNRHVQHVQHANGTVTTHELFMERLIDKPEAAKIEGNRVTFLNADSRNLVGDKTERYRYLFAASR